MFYLLPISSNWYCRTEKMLACDHENVKPDILILGKAPLEECFRFSCTANDDVMMCIKPGEHGSTYGGNPLLIAMAALEVVRDEIYVKMQKLWGKNLEMNYHLFAL